MSNKNLIWSLPALLIRIANYLTNHTIYLFFNIVINYSSKEKNTKDNNLSFFQNNF